MILSATTFTCGLIVFVISIYYIVGVAVDKALGKSYSTVDAWFSLVLLLIGSLLLPLGIYLILDRI